MYKLKQILGILTMTLLISTTSTKAQNLTLKNLEYKVGAFANVTEYNGDLISKTNLYNFSNVKPRFGIHLMEKLNASFTLEQRLQMYTVEFVENKPTDFKADFLAANINVRYNFSNGYIIKEDALINPFVLLGFGGVNINSTKLQDPKNAFVFSTGGGLSVRLNENIDLELATIFNWADNDSWDGIKGTSNKNDIAIVHSLGLVFNWGSSKDTDGDGVKDTRDLELNTPLGVAVDNNGIALDTDGDLIPDYLDKCKTEIGTTKTNGCPDKDNDGIVDAEDKCPNVPGIARFQGCPDTDGDGIDDANDKCPNIKGLDIFKGCPDTDGDGVDDANDKCVDTEKGIKVDAKGCPLDTDADGIIDSKDKCPAVKGIIEFEGCPAPKKVIKEDVKKRLEFAARSILFESSKSTIRTKSYPMLNEVATIMKEYSDYSLRMLGHTDNSGKDESNLILSQARVDAVKQYLISKGISEARLEAIGYGSARPITTNETAAGRTENRRVELELFLK